MRRRIGKLDDPAALRPGDHVCWTYASDEEHRRVLTAYLTAGLRADERVAYFGPGDRPTDVRGYLAEAGEDVDALAEQGRLIVAPAEAVYLGEGAFDATRMVGAFRAAAQQALAEGYAGLRAAADAAWVIGDPAVWEAYATYELRCDLMTPSAGLIALCSYDARQCSPEERRLLSAVHSLALGTHADGGIFRLFGELDGSLGIEGELDFTCSDPVASILGDAAPHVGRPCLDVSRLAFADVAGCRAIGAAAARIVEANGMAEIRGASPTLRRMWQLLGFDDRVPVRFVEHAAEAR